MRRLLPYLVAALSFWAASVPARGQERKDSVVTLVSAKSAQLIELRGQNYRKVVGPARFLHNNTYLLCDTALWNVTTNIIDAIGHVQIIQDRTRLSSGTLQYVVDDNLAKFRGGLVQLEDKDKNTLRTRYLDYNTKDSVAIFQNGASMRDKDGQIIESLYGSYDSKARLFVFNDQVNMYMDTTFVKTSRLDYRSDINTAYFGYGTDMWQDDNMLSANDGWYDRDRELFFFRRNVHLLTKDQETWSDTLYYYRALNNVDLLGHVEVLDTTRNVFALAGRMEYADSSSRVKMTRTPAVMSISEESGKRDTLYFGADSIYYQGIKQNKVDSLWKVDAKKRLRDLEGDPVWEYRRKAAEEAAKAAEQEAKNDPNAAARNRGPGGPPEGLAEDVPGPAKPEPVDTLMQPPPSDTLAAPPPVDSTRLSFIWAVSNVKVYRDDIQMSCDSLIYSDLDSLARLYIDPLVFNEGNRQYAADSIYVIIRNRMAERARLMSNAFVTTEEAPECYDQIRGTEMMAYFDSTRTVRRFDALGGATALFFLKENDALATVNKVESKMLYALFEDGYLDKIYYFDNAKNDAYPVVQLPQEERYMKGFRWNPERRPNGPGDITPLVPRMSQRTSYLAHPHAKFKETEVYFPGHINKIYKDIATRDSLEVVRAREAKEKPKEQPKEPESPEVPPVPSDSTGVTPLPMPSDSLKVVDALSEADESLRIQLDSLAEKPFTGAPADSLSMTTDSLSVASNLKDGTDDKKEDILVQEDPAKAAEQARKAEEKRLREEQKRLKEEERAKKRAEKEALKAQKKAEREAKWAEKDRIYEEKQAAKAQKKLEKERKRKLRVLRKLEKKAQKERKIFERYLEKERARAEKKAAREAEKAAREAEKSAREKDQEESQTLKQQ